MGFRYAVDRDCYICQAHTAYYCDACQRYICDQHQVFGHVDGAPKKHIILCKECHDSGKKFVDPHRDPVNSKIRD